MKLKLIPVFELEYSHPDVKFPPYPFSDEEYTNYLDQVYKLNGFMDPFEPIAEGYNLYAIQQTSENNLVKIIKDAIYKDQNSLEGGFVLCEIAETLNPILTHRCCSDLNDVDSWINLAKKNLTGFWIGHPMLSCKIENDQIRFIEEEEEELEDIVIPFSDYQIAIQELKQELIEIRKRILEISARHQLNNKSVSQLLNFTLIDQSNA